MGALIFFNRVGYRRQRFLAMYFTSEPSSCCLTTAWPADLEPTFEFPRLHARSPNLETKYDISAQSIVEWGRLQNRSTVDNEEGYVGARNALDIMLIWRALWEEGPIFLLLGGRPLRSLCGISTLLEFLKLRRNTNRDDRAILPL